MGWTPTQNRLLTALADGLPHSRTELLACLQDTEATLGNLQWHLAQLRYKLRQEGQEIVCEYHRRSLTYRHVRLLSEAGTG